MCLPPFFILATWVGGAVNKQSFDSGIIAARGQSRSKAIFSALVSNSRWKKETPKEPLLTALSQNKRNATNAQCLLSLKIAAVLTNVVRQFANKMKCFQICISADFD